jgi:hypothetical protein
MLRAYRAEDDATIALAQSQLENAIVWVPRLPHATYLRLLSLSDAFLGPIPFGSGVTSSDAIAVCVPPLVLPAATTVLQFTRAQVLEISKDVPAFKSFIVDSIADYGKLGPTLRYLILPYLSLSRQPTLIENWKAWIDICINSCNKLSMQWKLS